MLTILVVIICSSFFSQTLRYENKNVPLVRLCLSLNLLAVELIATNNLTTIEEITTVAFHLFN